MNDDLLEDIAQAGAQRDATNDDQPLAVRLANEAAAQSPATIAAWASANVLDLQEAVVGLRCERDALEADYLETLTGPCIGMSKATAQRVINATLREARGEP